nr:hybrid sensor histidine kinase/response regulator [Tunicatimonas sp. TK19036]
MLEDIWEDAYLTEQMLKKEGLSLECFVVDSQEGFVAGIQQFAPDIILSDHSLPQFDSIGALKISQQLCPNVPFILVTGTVSEEFAVTMLKRGASDYILKSNQTRLVPAIRQALKQRELQQQKQEAEEALRRQNSELLKVNAELDQFVYSASHDLRSPLTALMGLLALARKHEEELPRLQEYLDKMQISMDKLDMILREILEYSYNARQEIRLETINIKALIEKCFRSLEHVPGYANVERKVTVQQKVKLVSDRYRLTIILNSLIKNALQFHNSGKHPPFLHIDVSISDSVLLTFEDNGIGIKPQVLPNIYNMFYRGSARSQGAGLGLYVTKEIVTRLGGDINVTSVQGQGTLVTVLLPLHPSPDELVGELFPLPILGKLMTQFDKAGYLMGQEVVCKIFKPNSIEAWYCINIDPTDMESIWCIAVKEEAGHRQVRVCSVLRSELEGFTLPFLGLSLERDRRFKPINAQKAYEKLLSGEEV